LVPEGPGPPRGGCRDSPVTHWGAVDGMGQIYPNNTTFGARQGPHGVAPELLFGPQGVLARGTWWGRRGGPGFLQGGPVFGGRAGK
jgi:hypothetical protein